MDKNIKMLLYIFGGLFLLLFILNHIHVINISPTSSTTTTLYNPNNNNNQHAVVVTPTTTTLGHSNSYKQQYYN